MFRKCLFVAALVALCVVASSASAQCSVNRGFNRGVNLNVNRGFVGNGLRQVFVGNQLVTLDRFGNVVRRQFINRGFNSFGVNVAVGQRSLSDRLLFGF